MRLSTTIRQAGAVTIVDMRGRVILGQETASLRSLVPPFGITVTYFAGVQAAVARALARRRIMSFANFSRVKVHWNGAADFS